MHAEGVGLLLSHASDKTATSIIITITINNNNKKNTNNNISILTMKPGTIPYRTHPIMRLAHKIIETHWPDTSHRDHLDVFCDMFGAQLREAGCRDGIPELSAFTKSWSQRHRYKYWEKFLGDPIYMTDREFLSYLWLYDWVKNVSRKLSKAERTEAFYSDDEDSEHDPDDEAISLIDFSVLEFIVDSGGITIREGNLLGFDVSLPEKWAGTGNATKKFFIGRPLGSLRNLEWERCAWLKDVRETCRRKLWRREAARNRLGLMHDSPTASEKEDERQAWL